MKLFALARRLVRRLGSGDYRPERHYMRGPGPKCSERRKT